MNNELVEVSETTALAAFATPAGLDPIISQARELVESFEPDLSTDKGRKAIASLAGKVAKLKVKLDDAGKELVSEWKSKSKIVDGSRKSMRDELDALKIQARAPLTEWENKEKDRVAGHKQQIDYIEGWVSSTDIDGNLLDLDGLKLSLQHIEEVDTGTLEEFELEGVKKKEAAINTMTQMVDAEQKRIDNEAELERLRVAEEGRKQKERDEAMQREAAEEATRQAEAKAAEEAQKAEKERQDAIDRANDAERQAKESERARIEAEEKSKIEQKLAAERARLEEQKRQEEEAKAEKEAQEKREANKTHIGKVRKAAKEGLMQFIDEKTAVKIVLAIHAGDIKNVTINY